MSGIFHSLLASELLGFLQFKRSFGYGYMRAEFTLREFDRFLIEYVARNRRWRGIITQLRFDPCNRPDVKVSIGSIRLAH